MSDNTSNMHYLASKMLTGGLPQNEVIIEEPFMLQPTHHQQIWSRGGEQENSLHAATAAPEQQPVV